MPVWGGALAKRRGGRGIERIIWSVFRGKNNNNNNFFLLGVSLDIGWPLEAPPSNNHLSNSVEQHVELG